MSRITTHDFELISNLLDTIADLERQRDELNRKWEETFDLANRAAAAAEKWKTQLATAHAAAIQAAAEAVSEGAPKGEMFINCSEVILALTPATSQHLYDLRIAEAVRDEGLEWSAKINTVNAEEWATRRLASASAEVERLQSQEVNMKGESA